MDTVLITGAAGGIGSRMRQLLKGIYPRLILSDRVTPANLTSDEEFIAADLTDMQVIANIDESDVGRIRPGQPVTFTVDAYAAEEFDGTVSQIRLEPVVLQNVVTYATVIDVPNNELKLKPGMPATVTLEIARSEDTLRVPNAALRFRPTPDMFAALNQPVPDLLQRGGRGGGRPSGNRGAEAPANGGRSGGGRGGFGNFGDMSDAERQAMRERMQNMTPDERAEFFAARGGGRGGSGGRGGGETRRRGNRPGEAISTFDGGATTIDDIKHLVAGERGKQALLKGDADAGIWSAGMVAGLIHDVPSCRDLVERIMREAEAIIDGRLADTRTGVLPPGTT